MKTRISLALAALCCTMTAWSADPIDFEARAMPLRSVIDKLAAQTGEKLIVDPAFSRDTAVIKVHKIALEDLLAKIAAVHGGRWIKMADGVQRLIVDQDLLNRERAAKVARIRESLAKQIKEKKPGQNAFGIPMPADAEEPETVTDPSAANGQASPAVPEPDGDREENIPNPEQTLLVRALGVLPLGEIAAMQPGGRVVYSTSPTPMQRPISISMQWLREFADGNNRIYQKENNLSPEEQAQREQARQAMSMVPWFNDGTIDRRLIQEAPAKVNIVVSVPGDDSTVTSFLRGSDFNIEITVFDRQGKIIASANDYLSGESQGVMQEIIASARERAAAASGKPVEAKPAPKDPLAEIIEKCQDKPIEYSKISQEILKLQAIDPTSSGTTPELSKETLDALYDPVQFDPLSFQVAEGMFSIAQANDWQLVANVPDSFGLMWSYMSGGAKTTKSQFGAFVRDTTLKTVLEGGYLTIRPKDIEIARMGYSDRQAIAKLAATGRAKKVLSLDDIANYAAQNPAPEMGSVVMASLQLTVPDLFGGIAMGGQRNWSMLRLYGLLSPTQRKQMRGGMPIEFGQLGEREKGVYRKIVFGANQQLRTDEKTTGDEDLISAWISGMMPQKHTDYRTEPTELLPNGIPGNAQITASVEQDVMLQLEDTKNPIARMLGSMGTTELALIQSFLDTPMSAQMGAMLPRMDRFRVGSRQTVTMNLLLRPGVFVRERMHDDAMDPNAPVVGIDKLDKAVLEKLAKAKESIKKSPIFQMIGQEGNSEEPAKP